MGVGGAAAAGRVDRESNIRIDANGLIGKAEALNELIDRLSGSLFSGGQIFPIRGGENAVPQGTAPNVAPIEFSIQRTASLLDGLSGRLSTILERI